MQGSDSAPRIWDVKTGTKLLQLKKQDGAIQSVAFSPDGKMLLTGCEDGAARLWDTATGQELTQLTGHTAGIRSALFSTDGRTVFTSSYDGTVRQWNVAEMKNEGWQGLQNSPARVFSLALSPNGKRYATGQSDGTVHLWDVATGQEIWSFKGVGKPGIDKNGQSLWTLDSMGYCSVAFSPNGKQVLVGSGSDCVAHLYDVARHKEVRPLKGHKDYVARVAFSPDGKFIATGGGQWDKTTIIWDVITGRQIRKIKGGPGEVTALAFAPDSKRLLTATEYDETAVARLLDIEKGSELLVLKNKDTAFSAAFSSDGKRIVTGGGLGKVSVWDATTGKIILQLQGHKDVIRSAIFSSDGKRIATASRDGSARLWDAATGNELLRLTAPSALVRTSDTVSALAFSSNGKQLFTGHGDGATRIWRKMTDVQIASMERVQTALRQENEDVLHLEDAPLEVILQKAQTLLSKRPDQTYTIASGLNNAAWKVVDPVNPAPTPEKAKQALRVAEEAVTLTEAKNGLYLDTLAAAQFACGDLAGAVQSEKKAIQTYQVHSDKDTTMREELRAQLAKYEKLLADKQKGKR